MFYFVSSRESMTEAGCLVVRNQGHGVYSGQLRKPLRINGYFYYKVFDDDEKKYRHIQVERLYRAVVGRSDGPVFNEVWFETMRDLADIQSSFFRKARIRFPVRQLVLDSFVKERAKAAKRRIGKVQVAEPDLTDCFTMKEMGEEDYD